MLSFEDVINAPISKLDDTVAEWKKLQSKYHGLAEQLNNEIIKRLKDDWEGEASEAALKEMKAVRTQLEAAGTESQAIYLLLDDAAKEFRSAQKKLKQIVDEDAPAEKFKVTATGHVMDLDTTMTTGAQYDYHYQSHLSKRQARKKSWEKRILEIRREATAADEAAALGLKYDPNGKGSQNFNTNAVTSIDAVQVQQALNLAAKGREMSVAELNKLNHLLSINENDPEFSKRFALKLGPEGSLEFWNGVTQTQGRTDEKDFLKNLDDLERSLGTTLATATRQAGMSDWENRIISLGERQIGTDPRSDRSYGYQVMSNLMRHGAYDTDFLNKYGSALKSFEEKHTTGDGDNTRMPWDQSSYYTRLHIGDAGDKGLDPMVGFMEALGHNPKASQDFFKDEENFDYLTEERQWPAPANGSDTEEHPGYNSLGHALESATTGNAYDSPSKELNRNDSTTRIAENVMLKYGDRENSDLMHNQSGISDSLARIGAAYIDDLNYAMDDSRNTGSESTFFDGKRQQADLDSGDATRFLSVLGQDKDSHGIISSAQDTYTASLLVSNPPVDDASFTHGRQALTNQAEIQGVLDNSRVEQIAANFDAGSDAANEELTRSTDWIKWGAGATVGIGVGLIPVPGAPVIGAAIVPIAAELTESAFTTFFGHVIDKESEAHETEKEEEKLKSRDDVYGAGEEHLYQNWEAYRNSATENSPTTYEGWDIINRDISDAYSGGARNNENHGVLPN